MSDETGNEKLFEILDEMGEIGHKLYPKVPREFIVEALNSGIKRSLKVHKCKDWEEVAQKDLNTRKRILRGIMNAAQIRFEDVGMYDEVIDTLYARLDHEIERLVS